MEVIIKFLGLLGEDLPGLDLSEKMILRLPKDAKVNDIFNHFKIPVGKEYVVIINNKIANPLDALNDGVAVTIFQASYGG